MSDKGIISGGAKGGPGGEGMNPYMLRMRGISREGNKARKESGDLKTFEKPEYISGRRNSPHEGRSDSLNSYYKDHGAGNHHGEKKLPHDDKDISVRVFKNGPRHTSESTDLED